MTESEYEQAYQLIFKRICSHLVEQNTLNLDYSQDSINIASEPTAFNIIALQLVEAYFQIEQFKKYQEQCHTLINVISVIEKSKKKIKKICLNEIPDTIKNSVHPYFLSHDSMVESFKLQTRGCNYIDKYLRAKSNAKNGIRNDPNISGYSRIDALDADAEFLLVSPFIVSVIETLLKFGIGDSKPRAVKKIVPDFTELFAMLSSDFPGSIFKHFTNATIRNYRSRLKGLLDSGQVKFLLMHDCYYIYQKKMDLLLPLDNSGWQHIRHRSWAPTYAMALCLF